MKKVLGFIILVFAASMLAISCKNKISHDRTSGIVDEINDSVMIARIGADKVKFDITTASFTNGAVMYGDSVIIHYVGDLSKKRALAKSIYLIVRPGTVVELKEGEIDSTKTLETRPVENKDVLDNIDNLIRLSNEKRKNQ